MATWHLLMLSHGSLLLGLLALGWRERRHSRRLREVNAHHALRVGQVQALRDALHGWLMKDEPLDVEDLQQTVEHLTSLHTWWFDAESPIITEAQVSDAPFQVNAHLATLALQKQYTVHRHQWIQWGWANAYIPIHSPQHSHALLVLASADNLSADEHAFAVVLAEMLGNAWSHTSSRMTDPAITRP